MQTERCSKARASDRRVSAMVVFYVAASVVLFSRFFWLAPLSAVALVTLVLAAISFRLSRSDPTRGLMAVCFLTPLTGSLHHMAPERCPAPLLLIAAAFALGWWLHRRRNPAPSVDAAAPGSGAAALLYLLIAVVGILTAWRYLNFVPFGTWPGLDTPVNVKNETVFDAVGDIWQTLVIGLSGPLLFVIVTNMQLGEAWLGRWVRALLIGVLVAFLVGLAQMLLMPSFGIAAYWVERGRISATFTDPNALGTFIALIFPLAVAMALRAGDRATRRLGGAVVLLGLVMLVGSGSRTGAAGLVLGAFLYPVVMALRMRRESEEFRRGVVFSAFAIVIALVTFLPRGHGPDEPTEWPLLRRLSKTRELISREGLLAPLVRDRWPLWKPAAYVAWRYPLGGIGLGAFRYEIDNIARLDARRWKWLDNANNFYIHTVSEMGLPGLAVVLVALASLAGAIVRVVRSGGPTGEDRAIYSALAIGWFGFLILLSTALWLAFEQIQATFWLIAAAFACRPDSRSARGVLRRRWPHALGYGVVALVAVYQLAHGFGDLSPDRRRQALGLRKETGFYGWEMDESGRRFRWTKEQATMAVPVGRREIRLELRARNPDLASRPLVVWFTVGGKFAGRREIRSPQWQWIRFPVPPGLPNPADLTIRVERTWRPSDFAATKDNRRLGVAVGRVENVDTDSPPPPAR